MSVRSMLSWTAALIAFVFVFMFMYPPLSKDVQILENILSNFPLELREVLGITTLNLSQITGFYGFIFVYILLIGSVFAMKSGLSVLSEEIRSKASDFLLVKPVRRATIVGAKVLSVLCNLVIQNILFIIFSYIIVIAYNSSSFNIREFTLINFSLIQVQFFFAALGLLLSVIIKKIKNVLPLTLGVVFAFFVIQMLNQTLNDPKIAYVTPFAYFDVAEIINNSGYDMSFLLINWIIIFLLTCLSYLIYNNKDMPSI